MLKLLLVLLQLSVVFGRYNSIFNQVWTARAFRDLRAKMGLSTTIRWDTAIQNKQIENYKNTPCGTTKFPYGGGMSGGKTGTDGDGPNDLEEYKKNMYDLTYNFPNMFCDCRSKALVDENGKSYEGYHTGPFFVATLTHAVCSWTNRKRDCNENQNNNPFVCGYNRGSLDPFWGTRCPTAQQFKDTYAYLMSYGVNFRKPGVGFLKKDQAAYNAKVDKFFSRFCASGSPPTRPTLSPSRGGQGNGQSRSLMRGWLTTEDDNQDFADDNDDQLNNVIEEEYGDNLYDNLDFAEAKLVSDNEQSNSESGASPSVIGLYVIASIMIVQLIIVIVILVKKN